MAASPSFAAPAFPEVLGGVSSDWVNTQSHSPQGHSDCCNFWIKAHLWSLRNCSNIRREFYGSHFCVCYPAASLCVANATPAAATTTGNSNTAITGPVRGKSAASTTTAITPVTTAAAAATGTTDSSMAKTTAINFDCCHYCCYWPSAWQILLLLVVMIITRTRASATTDLEFNKHMLGLPGWRSW